MDSANREGTWMARMPFFILAGNQRSLAIGVRGTRGKDASKTGVRLTGVLV
jgi:hypothetical protein